MTCIKCCVALVCVQLHSEQVLVEVHQLEVERVELMRRIEGAEVRTRDMQHNVVETERQLDELKRDTDMETARNADLQTRFLSATLCSHLCIGCLLVVFL